MDVNARVIPLSLHPLGFIEAFTQLGAPLDGLLRDTGIDRSMLQHKDVRISYAQQRRLLRNGVSLCRRPGLGLQVGMLFDWCYHGTVGYVVYCSPSLKAAGEAFYRYRVIAQPHYATSKVRPAGYVDRNGQYVLPISRFAREAASDPEMARFLTELRLAIIVRFWDACGNKSVPDPSVHVRLGYPEPDYAELYQRLPCSTVTFGCAHTEVAAHHSVIVEEFRLYRRRAFQRLLEQCERELRQSRLQLRFSEQVRTYIGLNFHCQPTLEDTARALGTTPRGLARRLAAERTSFRNIQREVRLEWTMHHLRLSRLGVEEISRLMGFSCAASLRRAVKAASGKTVSAIRSGGG